MRSCAEIFVLLSFLLIVSCGENEVRTVDQSTGPDETVVTDEDVVTGEEAVTVDDAPVVGIDDTVTDELVVNDQELVDEMPDETPDDISDTTELPDEEMTEELLMDRAAGRYAHYDIVAYYSDMGLMGIFKNLIISYGFTTFEKEDGKLKITDRFCHSEQISNQNFTAIVPDAMTRAIIPDSTFIEIKKDANGDLFLYRPETPTLLGIAYEDPYNNHLPDSIKPDDPRLVDADFDGNPGVTVFINMFNKMEKLYVARREVFAFDAYLTQSGNIEGIVRDESEQLIIDATNILLKNQTGEWLQYRGPNGDDYSLSPIILVPIDDSYDCDTLMQERDAFFPPNPTVWED